MYLYLHSTALYVYMYYRLNPPIIPCFYIALFYIYALVNSLSYCVIEYEQLVLLNLVCIHTDVDGRLVVFCFKCSFTTLQEDILNINVNNCNKILSTLVRELCAVT